MGQPLDNPASVPLRAAAADPNAVRSEPVVEFARKKNPTHAVDAYDELQPLGSPVVFERESRPLRLFELPQISLPRDNDQPLVTAEGRYAKDAIEAYNGLRTRLLRSQATQGFRSIAITSVGKSDGKTLTSFNLACCCAQVENFSVLLIDADLRGQSLTKLIGRLPVAGLSDVMSGSALCEDAIVRTDVGNLYVMGAGSKDVDPSGLFMTNKWSEVIRWGTSHFKMVLVDGLPTGVFADFELIAPECDGILLVVRARSTARESLKTAIEQLDPRKLVGIVWNGSDLEKNPFLY